MSQEIPSIMNYINASQTYSGTDFNLGLSQTTYSTPYINSIGNYNYAAIQQQEKKEIKMADKIGRRIVQVFIVDPHSDVPLDKSILHRGEQKLTDATDQELFFEVDIKSLLDSHNKDRVKLLDKKASKAAGKDITLEEVRIRDLKMIVTNIAEF